MSDYLNLNIPVCLTQPWEPGIGTPTHLAIRLYQCDGGTANWYGQVSKRGVYLSVAPIKIEKTDSMVATTFFMGYGGVKRILEENKRKNRRRGEELATEVRDQINFQRGKAWETIQKVLQEYHLKFVDENRGES